MGCYYSSHVIGYKTVALFLLVTVSIIAMLFDILPVLSAALLSALIWNFFFIPPIFTFHINNTEDLLMFLLYFLIALVNAVLTFKIRKEEMKARDKVEKENTIKLYNTLLNSLSHELRTPISTIIGAIDTLKENKEKISLSNQNELFNQIDIASIRLNRQVENLLNMSRLETGMLKLNLDWCDVNELINSTIQKLDQLYQQTIVFEPDESMPLIKLDRGLMVQVLQNILYNAINYTPENSRIKIVAKLQSNSCIITISDNGKGFPEHEIPLAFDKFYRLPHTKTGGSGLGLSIVKGFIEAHYGTIKLENNLHGGALFTISIPAETSYLNNLKNE
ncbi:MAG: PAS domain-containing sensor histidine kinase [Bacteroidetes bacterium]|nr:PAS domain-containing sensor histidine kinase [Bacteroidota bacterium]